MRVGHAPDIQSPALARLQPERVDGAAPVHQGAVAGVVQVQNLAVHQGIAVLQKEGDLAVVVGVGMMQEQFQVLTRTVDQFNARPGGFGLGSQRDSVTGWRERLVPDRFERQGFGFVNEGGHGEVGQVDDR